MWSITIFHPALRIMFTRLIGRTGRAGAKWIAFNFFVHSNAKFSRDLIKILQEARQVLSPSFGSSFGGSSLSPFDFSSWHSVSWDDKHSCSCYVASARHFHARGQGEFANRSLISGSNAIPLGSRRPGKFGGDIVFPEGQSWIWISWVVS